MIVSREISGEWRAGTNAEGEFACSSGLNCVSRREK